MTNVVTNFKLSTVLEILPVCSSLVALVGSEFLSLQPIFSLSALNRSRFWVFQYARFVVNLGLKAGNWSMFQRYNNPLKDQQLKLLGPPLRVLFCALIAQTIHFVPAL